MMRKNGSLHRGIQITACQMLNATVIIYMFLHPRRSSMSILDTLLSRCPLEPCLLDWGVIVNKLRYMMVSRWIQKVLSKAQNKGEVTRTISSALILSSYFVLASLLLFWPRYCLEPFYWGKKKWLGSFPQTWPEVGREVWGRWWMIQLEVGDGSHSERHWLHCPLLHRAYIQRWWVSLIR